MSYKAVGFDWNGVIFGQSGGDFSKHVAELLGVSLEEFRKAYFTHNHLITKGKSSLVDFWKEVLEELNKQDKLSNVLDYIENKPKGEINEEMVSIIAKLKNSGLKVGLLSNETVEGGDKIRQTEVAKYFDVILISAEVGLMKPENKMFELLISKLGIKPDELIFIDDAEKSLSKSTEIGFTPVLFSNPHDLLAKLSELKVL